MYQPHVILEKKHVNRHNEYTWSLLVQTEPPCFGDGKMTRNENVKKTEVQYRDDASWLARMERCE